MNFDKFAPQLGDWAEKLRPFIESEQCDKIYARLKADSNRGKIICPAHQDTYRAFRETPWKQLKAVFIAQDPYPWVKDGQFVADGLALSCSNTKVLQPSLSIFYDGIEDDIGRENMPEHSIRDSDLSHLSYQGIMMLNSALTVEKDLVGSHRELWMPFTQYLLEEVFTKSNKSLIFILMGKEAQYFNRYINPMQHTIYEIEHPAAAAHKQRKWEHKNVFSKVSRLVKENHSYNISWMSDLPF